VKNFPQPALPTIDRNGGVNCPALSDGRWVLLAIGLVSLLVMSPLATGQVYHWATETYVSGVSVRAAGGDGTLIGVTDTFGDLALGGHAGALELEFGVGQREQNAIRAADALAALRIAVGLPPRAGGPPASPFQFWAADFNGDGRVTAADALEILKRAVRSSDAQEKRWVFVPKSLALDSGTPITRQRVPNPGPVVAGEHVVAVLVGDVLGSWVPPDGAVHLGTQPPDGPVFPPQGLQIISGDGSITVQWTEVPGASRSTLYLATEGAIQPANFGVWISQHNGLVVDNVASPHTVLGLPNDIEYFAVVTATFGLQETLPSNEVSAIPRAAIVRTGELNDTGINWSGEGISGNSLLCSLQDPIGQDCHYGRDAQSAAGTLVKVGSGSAGFDFTKISNNGSVLPNSATLGDGFNDWACTRDNVTGLLWEVKVDDASQLRHRDHTYTWYDPNTRDDDSGILNGGLCLGSGCDTNSLVQVVNQLGLCGATDWRMPTTDELEGIADFGGHSPAIDLEYFPNTASSNYWSAGPLANASRYAWIIGFDNGGAGYNVKSAAHRVRLVRGGQ
jgi:hypothetical protein